MYTRDHLSNAHHVWSYLKLILWMIFCVTVATSVPSLVIYYLGDISPLLMTIVSVALFATISFSCVWLTSRFDRR